MRVRRTVPGDGVCGPCFKGLEIAKAHPNGRSVVTEHARRRQQDFTLGLDDK